ncbi:MAG: hypothetical protein AAGC55_13770, partial [Myxococcota bacterium]
SSGGQATDTTRDLHGALTQLHRWYQLYERPFTDERIARQLEILDPTVEVKSSFGTAVGHEQYLAGINALPPNDKNAHQVMSAQVEVLPGGQLALSTATRYQRLQPDGTLTSIDLRYQTELRRDSGGLPVFTKIHISPVAPSEDKEFSDVYLDNRVKSFVHYWLFLMEALDGDAEPFRELLAEDGFALHFSSSAGPMTRHEQLAAWLAAVPTQLSMSSHRVANITFADGDEIAVSLDFDWRGQRKDGVAMKGRTHHEWKLVDTGERFLRMREARVTVVEPLSTVAAE